MKKKVQTVFGNCDQLSRTYAINASSHNTEEIN